MIKLNRTGVLLGRGSWDAKRHQTHAYAEGQPCEDTGRRCIFTSQGGRSQEKPNLPTP